MQLDIVEYFFTPTSVAVIFVACFFIYITRDSWKELIKKIIINYKNKSLSAQTSNEQRDAPNTKQESEESKKAKQLLINLGESEEKIKILKKNNADLFGYWKFYMLSYLNLYLVNSTKLSLLWLKDNPNKTKSMFKANISTAQNVLDKELEKEAIFNALVSNYLITKDVRDLYSVTDIGLDFLKFIGFSKN